MRRRLTMAAVIGVAFLAACADEPVGNRSTGPSFDVAGSEGTTYVVLGANNTLPASFSTSVEAAGGVVDNAMSRIGVAVVRSNDPLFASRLRTASGISSVSQDVQLQFDVPTMIDAGEAGEAGDVGASGIGDIETFRAIQWAPDAISAPAAWNAGHMGAGVRVAILDGGIHSTHIDISPNLDVARSASFVAGFNFNQDVGTFWHGTHVAGIVAAPANNIGTVGMAPQATIIGVKVLHNGSGSFAAVIQGIYYAATSIANGGAGAQVINMSLGARIQKGADKPADAAAIRELLKGIDNATTYAFDQGVTVIGSAGNNAENMDLLALSRIVHVPGQSKHVIGVSALAPAGYYLGFTNADLLASYSNYGVAGVDLSGPGGDSRWPGNEICTYQRFPGPTLSQQFCWVLDLVLAPCRGSGASISSYCWAAGTSMSAPAVAGVAALALGRHGPMTKMQLERHLRATSDDLGAPGLDPIYGYGRVNAWRAVQ